jgi:CRISPR-associated protein Cmr5
MSRNIEKYIPRVMEVLNEEFSSNESISSAYNGYISSFGVSIIQSGLEPTLALFENRNNQDTTKADKTKIPKIILKVLAPEYNGDSLLRYLLEHQNEEENLKKDIIDIAIALKLCIRTFKFDKGDKK